MLLFTSIIAILLAVATFATADRWGRRPDIVLAKRGRNLPEGYSVIRDAPKDTRVKFLISLRQKNLDILEDLFWRVSNPEDKLYGNYMSAEEILDIISPLDGTVERVIMWLLRHGVSIADIENRRDSVFVQTEVEKIEKLFDIKLSLIRNPNGNHIVRAYDSELKIPRHFLSVIQIVSGLTEMPPVQSSIFKKPMTSGTYYLAPQTIYESYSIGDTAASAAASLGVAEFQGDSGYNPKDLQKFYQQTGVVTTPVSNIVGPQPSGYDGEASLDIQYATAVGRNATNWYWTESNWMLDFANALFNAKDIPQVISMSWGWSEVQQCTIDQDCSTLGIDSSAYVSRVNVEFQKIGLRGTSLLASSGDSGANGRTDEYCSNTVLHPIFPAGSPYVTAVGATELHGNFDLLANPPTICNGLTCASNGTEAAVSFAVSGFTSGGGFSNYTTTPSYQQGQVQQYLSTATLPSAGMFNPNGRGYPDVSAFGHNFLCLIGGGVTPVGGTSASSPTFAGVLAILNTVRAKAGQPSIGFANPFLYKMAQDHPAAFTDVTIGDNKCTESGCASTCQGFVATAGWDPVTGLGTPVVSEMIKYIQGQTAAQF